MEGLELPVDGLDRRRLLKASGAGLAAVTLAASAQPALSALLRPTPRQALGPFYPDRLPLDSDNDLVRIAGRRNLAKGQIIHIFGQLRGVDGQPISGAKVEIWQCDAFGRYIHSADAGRGRSDGNFQGYGTAWTDDTGAYRFRTIRPVPYPGRAPHIHFQVTGDRLDRFVTQMYVAGDPRNQRDGLLNRVTDLVMRQSLLVDLQPAPELDENALSGRFDIAIG